MYDQWSTNIIMFCVTITGLLAKFWGSTRNISVQVRSSIFSKISVLIFFNFKKHAEQYLSTPLSQICRHLHLIPSHKFLVLINDFLKPFKLKELVYSLFAVSWHSSCALSDLNQLQVLCFFLFILIELNHLRYIHISWERITRELNVQMST